MYFSVLRHWRVCLPVVQSYVIGGRVAWILLKYFRSVAIAFTIKVFDLTSTFRVYVTGGCVGIKRRASAGRPKVHRSNFNCGLSNISAGDVPRAVNSAKDVPRAVYSS